MTGYQQDVLDGMSTDPTPSAVSDRDQIGRAVMAAASERRGLVHITSIRRHLPRSVSPRYIGSTVNRLARRGVLVKTGRYEDNGDTGRRNGNKPSPVWRLTRAIEPEDLA